MWFWEDGLYKSQLWAQHIHARHFIGKSKQWNFIIVQAAENEKATKYYEEMPESKH